MQGLFHELRLGFRQLRTQPGHAAVVILTLGSSLGTLGMAAVLAHWVPARRAAMVNPVDALRHD